MNKPCHWGPGPLASLGGLRGFCTLCNTVWRCTECYFFLGINSSHSLIWELIFTTRMGVLSLFPAFGDSLQTERIISTPICLALALYWHSSILYCFLVTLEWDVIENMGESQWMRFLTTSLQSLQRELNSQNVPASAPSPRLIYIWISKLQLCAEKGVTWKDAWISCFIRFPCEQAVLIFLF